MCVHQCVCVFPIIMSTMGLLKLYTHTYTFKWSIFETSFQHRHQHSCMEVVNVRINRHTYLSLQVVYFVYYECWKFLPYASFETLWYVVQTLNRLCLVLYTCSGFFFTFICSTFCFLWVIMIISKFLVLNVHNYDVINNYVNYFAFSSILCLNYTCYFLCLLNILKTLIHLYTQEAKKFKISKNYR